MFPIDSCVQTLGLQLVTVFLKVMEALGNGFQRFIVLSFYSCVSFSVCSLLLDHRPNVTSCLRLLPASLSWDDGLYLLQLGAKINLPHLKLLSVKFLVTVTRKVVKSSDESFSSMASYFLTFHGPSHF